MIDRPTYLLTWLTDIIPAHLSQLNDRPTYLPTYPSCLTVQQTCPSSLTDQHTCPSWLTDQHTYVPDPVVWPSNIHDYIPQLFDFPTDPILNNFWKLLTHCVSYNQKQDIVSNKACENFDENQINLSQRYWLGIKRMANMGEQPEYRKTSSSNWSYSGRNLFIDILLHFCIISL